MSTLLKQIGLRLLFIPLTLFIITAALYGVVMLASAEERAELYLPPNLPRNMEPARYETVIADIIADKGLNDPYPVQYVNWVGETAQR